MYISKKAIKTLKEVSQDETFVYKTILDQWNQTTPHFGGSGPHRYDGDEKECAYCGRPKNWKPLNAGYLSLQITEENFSGGKL